MNRKTPKKAIDLDSFDIVGIRNTATYRFLRDYLFLPRIVAIRLTQALRIIFLTLGVCIVLAIIVIGIIALNNEAEKWDENLRKQQEQLDRIPVTQPPPGFPSR